MTIYIHESHCPFSIPSLSPIPFQIHTHANPQSILLQRTYTQMWKDEIVQPKKSKSILKQPQKNFNLTCWSQRALDDGEQKRGGKRNKIKDRTFEEWCFEPFSNLIIDFGYYLKPGISINTLSTIQKMSGYVKTQWSLISSTLHLCAACQWKTLPLTLYL